MDERTALRRLLAHYSPSGAEARAVREFCRLARSLGFSTRVDAAGNGIATRGRGRPLLLFLGHIDTVEGDRPVREAGGRIHGRGAVDAKGPLACALAAGARFAGPGSLRVVAAVREETDSRGARHLLRGPRPDFVIVGEPSGWDGVTLGYRGDLRVEATFRQARSHWSSPHPTAADRAFGWLGRLQEGLNARRGESPFRSLSGKLVGAHAHPSADPEVATLLLDLRIPPGVTSGEVLALLPREGEPRIRVLTRIEPIERDRTDPVARALVAAIRAEGGHPTLYRRTGTSDLNVVGPVWRVPAAAYGPGDSRLDHTSRESVSRAELGRSVRVLARVFGELSGPPSASSPGSGVVP